MLGRIFDAELAASPGLAPSSRRSVALPPSPPPPGCACLVFRLCFTHAVELLVSAGEPAGSCLPLFCSGPIASVARPGARGDPPRGAPRGQLVGRVPTPFLLLPRGRAGSSSLGFCRQRIGLPMRRSLATRRPVCTLAPCPGGRALPMRCRCVRTRTAWPAPRPSQSAGTFGWVCAHLQLCFRLLLACRFAVGAGRAGQVAVRARSALQFCPATAR